jgi:carboxymethylenebutenolidase
MRLPSEFQGDVMKNPDFESLVPSRAFNRRDFVRTGVGSGFAAAVLPTLAQSTIKTSSDGLTVGEVTIPVGGFRMPAYCAAPARKSNLPVVLVVSEIFGVHEHIADVARRFAQQGYMAVAPELFVRQGDAGSYAEIAKLVAEVVNKVPDEQVMGDLDATLQWAGANGGDVGRAGITGFCWGGRITWLHAAHHPAIKAGVAWYGRLVGQSNPLQPQNPVEQTARLRAPVLGLYGGQDQGIPLDTVERMKAALAQGSPAAQKSQFQVYAEAPHAFHADYRPSFRKEAAEDGWRRCLAWFRAQGVA